MLNKSIYEEILKEYEQLGDIAKKRLERKKQILYKKCHRIEEIDLELNLTGIKISKIMLSKEKEKKEEYVAQIKQYCDKLKEERKRLMIENGFPETYLQNIYNCKRCKDTGFINNVKCECFKQKIINKVYNMSNISEVIKFENFSTFNKNYYTKNFYDEDKNDVSAFDNINNIIKKLVIAIEEIEMKPFNIIFYGSPGVGKTFLCRCIAKQLLDSGKVVIYTTAFELFEMFEKYKFSKENEDFVTNKLDFILEADLLILDDLGTEFITSLSTTEFFNVINSRLLNKKSTVISTNLSPKKIKEVYSTRIVSRLYGEYDMMKIYGNDIRIQKKFNKI